MYVLPTTLIFFNRKIVTNRKIFRGNYKKVMFNFNMKVSHPPKAVLNNPCTSMSFLKMYIWFYVFSFANI